MWKKGRKGRVPLTKNLLSLADQRQTKKNLKAIYEKASQAEKKGNNSGRRANPPVFRVSVVEKRREG